MQRRTFLGAMATAGGRALGSNDRLRAGIIGAGGRGRLLMEEFKEAGAEVTAVCDVYEPNLLAGQAAAPGSKAYGDYRRMLEDNSIDVVIIATPDHWHCTMAIDAVQAGKDVYLEKPMAHAIDEGFRLIDAVRRTKRVVQIGSQRRSFDLFMEAKKIVDSGALGEVRLVNSWWMDTTPRALPRRELKGKLDWESWLGPARKREFDPLRFFSWGWFLDYGGGYLAGQAVHIVDAISWMMNSTYPLAVSSAGRFDLKGAEYPETGSMTLEYPDYLAVFTLSYKAMRYRTPVDQLKQFHGSKARFDLGREAFALYPEDRLALDLKPSIAKRVPNGFNAATRAHILNFLDCVRRRRDPNATVEHGQAASVVRSMAIEAQRAGRRVRFDADARVMV
jgi:predicted dehydrogenase